MVEQYVLELKIVTNDIFEEWILFGYQCEEDTI